MNIRPIAVAVVLALVSSASSAAPGTETRPEDPQGLNWESFGRTHAEDHYSPLDQINEKTVGRLGLKWYADLGLENSFSSPLEVDGVLYFATGFSVLHAMDARTGKEFWHYDPEVYKQPGDKQRAGWPIRGIAFDSGRVFAATLDGRLIAVDAKTGKLLWSVMTIETSDERYITGSPWVFKGKVVIGHGGADNGPFRGYVTAYDQRTGKQLWRFYTVPGNPVQGFENKAMAMAAKTWTGEWWKWGGGGTVWQAMAYDARFNRLYIGTGNGFPWNRKIRSPGGGDNLFLCSIVALDADTGKYIWHYQVNPGEAWDYNADMDIELTDLVVDGQSRPVILHAPKNGFFYVIDRSNGKLISTGKFAHKINWADHIDLATGRPVENPGARYSDGKLAVVYPASAGAHSIAAMSFNPKTGLVYLPASDQGAYYIDPPNLATWQPLPRMVVNTGVDAPPPGTPPLPPRTSFLVAWNPVTQTAAWEIPLQNAENGGTVTTAGNIVVQGQSTGEFDIFAADTGKKIWSFDAQNGILSNPITYMLDGKQYVTVITGFRSYMANKPSWDYRQQKRRVLTFALYGNAALPPNDSVEPPVIDDPNFKIDPHKAEAGATIYGLHCFVCHGMNALAGGAAPDLRKSAVPLSLDALTNVVHGGALRPGGMPRFEELTAAELENLQHYIRQRARETMAAKQ